MVLFVRRFIDEPPLFKAAREKAATGAQRQSWLEIFSPEIIKTTVLTSLLTTGAQGGYYALFTWLPTYLKAERKLSIIGSGGYIAVVIIGSFICLLLAPAKKCLTIAAVGLVFPSTATAGALIIRRSGKLRTSFQPPVPGFVPSSRLQYRW